VLREPDYPEGRDVRRVRSNGEIKWQGKLVYINAALAGEPVGLTEGEDGAWRVCYGPVALGVIDHRRDRLKKPARQACGLVDNAARCPQGPQPQQQQLNETRNVLPMSPVRSVTHVPGCSHSAGEG
jgi:hypothetical protein